MNETENIAVFQCRYCNLIIGDSLSLVAVDEKNRTLTLSHVINISEDNKNKILAKDKENPTIYRDLYCKCGKIIGKKHISVGINDQKLLRNFTFDSEYIYTYQLSNPTNNGIEIYNNDNNRLTDIDKDILGKIQYLLVSLTERIEKIEDQLKS